MKIKFIILLIFISFPIFGNRYHCANEIDNNLVPLNYVYSSECNNIYDYPIDDLTVKICTVRYYDPENNGLTDLELETMLEEVKDYYDKSNTRITFNNIDNKIVLNSSYYESIGDDQINLTLENSREIYPDCDVVVSFVKNLVSENYFLTGSRISILYTLYRKNKTFNYSFKLFKNRR